MDGGWAPAPNWKTEADRRKLPIRFYQRSDLLGPMVLVPTEPADLAPLMLEFPADTQVFDGDGRLLDPPGGEIPLTPSVTQVDFTLLKFPLPGDAAPIRVSLRAVGGARWVKGGIVLTGVELELAVPHLDKPIRFQDGYLSLDDRLCIGPSAPKAGETPAGQLDLAVEAAGAIPLLEGCRLELLAGARVRLSLLPTDPFFLVYAEGTASARVVVGPKDIEAACFTFVLESHDIHALATGDEPKTILRWEPGGLLAKGEVVRRAVALTGQVPAVQVESGTVAFSGRDLALHAEGSAAVNLFFDDGRGRFELDGSTATGCVTAKFHADLARSWSAIDGWIVLEEPHVDVTVKFDATGEEPFDAQVRFGGTLVLSKKAPIGDFLDGLFGDTRLPIGTLDLKSLEKETFPLPLRDHPEVELGPLLLRLEKVELGLRKLTFGGSVRVDVPSGVRAEGNLPPMTLAFEKGEPIPKLVTERWSIEGLHLDLAIPGGLSASATVKKHPDGFSGRAMIDIPGFAALDATLDVTTAGGFPSIFLFVEAEDLEYPLFGGVVLRGPGVGVGVNRSYLALAAETLPRKEELGSLHPDRPEQWAPDRDRHAVMVAAHLVPLKKPPANTQKEWDATPQGYVMEVFLILDSMGNLMAIARGWALTSWDDATEKPLVVGALALRPRRRTLEARAATQKGPKFSVAMPLVEEVLNAVDASFYMFVSPDRFDLALGPVVMRKDMGPLRLEGTLMVGATVSQGELAVLATMSTSAVLHAEAKVNVGDLLSVTASAHIEFHCGMMLAGGVLDDGTLAVYGRAHMSGRVELSLQAKLKIHIEVDLWFTTIVIDIRLEFSFHFELSVSIDAQLGLFGRDVGFEGEAKLALHVLGVSLSIQLGVASNETMLKDVRDRFEHIAARLSAA